MGELLMGPQWSRKERNCLPSNLVLVYEVSKVLKPPFKYNIKQEEQSFGEGGEQTERLILLIRGTGRAGGFHLQYVVCGGM